MSNLYKTISDEVAPTVPNWLRGKFFEVTEEIKTVDGNKTEYVGWLWFKADGTMIFGEPGE